MNFEGLTLITAFHSALGNVRVVERIEDIMSNSDSQSDSRRESASVSPRDPRHYLLLVEAIVFFAEFVVFLTAALHNAGRMQGTALRFLVLTICVFLTSVAAFFGFARRINFAVGVFVGLLLVQPAIGALANAVGSARQEDLTVAMVTGIGGVLLLSVALVACIGQIGTT
ncbi:MAG: hypothetical protein ABI718_16685 [Acidobacteriota bacterium]